MSSDVQALHEFYCLALFDVIDMKAQKKIQFKVMNYAICKEIVISRPTV